MVIVARLVPLIYAFIALSPDSRGDWQVEGREESPRVTSRVVARHHDARPVRGPITCVIQHHPTLVYPNNINSVGRGVWTLMAPHPETPAMPAQAVEQAWPRHDPQCDIISP